MPKRYVPLDLTEPEAAVQREQGKVIGPTVCEQPIRRMTAKELRELLFRLTRDGGGARRKHWYARQRKKIEAELRRRAA